jgi:hypothetical protein
MFYCQFCNKVSKSKESPVKIITKTRNKYYYNEEGKIVGEGWEIVEEKTSCLKCAISRKGK